MNMICKEFDLRIKNEEVKGTCEWIRSKRDNYKERYAFEEYATNLPKNNYTLKQHLIFHFSLLFSRSVIDQQELEIDLPKLDDEEIEELMAYYDIENPKQRYEEIKTQIAAPTSYLTRIPYNVIRELYKRGRIPFDKQIFAACLIRFNVWHGASYSSSIPKDTKEKFDTFFPKDDFTLDVLMAVFEMELGVDSAYYVDRELTISAIIIELVNRNILSRAAIQQKLFDAFNNPTLKQTTHGWAKNIYRDLSFTLEENIACQSQLIQLLYNDRNLITNFGIQQLKKIASHTSFNWSLLIQSLDGIVYREKLTGGLKTVLSILYKKTKQDKTLIEECCIQLAPIFLQEDSTLQTAAKQCFQLLNTPNDKVKEALIPFVDTMHSEVKEALSDLLGEEMSTTESTYQTYQQTLYTPLPCTEEGKIAYISSEDDFIFLLSKVLKSNDPLDYELFLEAILRYSYLKDTHLKTLQPALKQATKIVERLDINARTGMHHLMAAKLLCMWLSDTPSTIEMDIEEWKQLVKKEKRYQYVANRWISIFNQFKRITHIIHQLYKGDNLPLLSTPTHHTFDIHPHLFWERITLYFNAKQTPDETDFCMALCRLNRWTDVNLTNVDTSTEYHQIIHYLLDPNAAFDDKKIKILNNAWLAAYALKNPKNAIDTLIANFKKEKWWARNYHWDWHIYREYSDNRKYSWAKLLLNFNQNREVINTSVKNYFDHHFTTTEFIIADAPHWFIRDGHIQEPLYLNLIFRTFNYYSDLEASETKSVLEVIKYNAEYPVPLEKIGYLFLSLSLFSSKTTIRSASFDWLSALIENKMLHLQKFVDTTSKIIIAKDHPTPIARVIEQFDRMAPMQGVYSDILCQTIEKCMDRIIIDDLPKSVSKLLHHYYEVLQIVNKPIPTEITTILHKLASITTIKKEAKKLLSLTE